MAAEPLQLEYSIVDVFTQTRYEGNPLAIVRIPKSCTLSQDQKLSITREFNLSETTFVHEDEDAAESSAWVVDIFMTTGELPFAGHPTIGTACFLLSNIARKRGGSSEVEAKLLLKAGPVQLRYDPATDTARAEIPHDVHIHERTWSRVEMFGMQPQLAEAYRKGAVRVKEEFPIASIVRGMTFVLIELESLDALKLVATSGLNVSVSGLDEGWSSTFVGTYFFVRTGDGQDGTKLLRTRMIEGTLEDPATGSAASDLAAYLSLTEGGLKQTLNYAITQGVEMGRRSDIHVEVHMKDTNAVDRVVLGGGAVRVMEGRLIV